MTTPTSDTRHRSRPATADPRVVANVAATTAMAGMAWTVQQVHYPLLARVGPDDFDAYMAEHRSRITALIGLPWAVQGSTSLALAVRPPAGVPRWLTLVGAALAGTTVATTVGWAVPLHRRLAEGRDEDALRRLLAVSWLRTAAWTGHAAVALAIAARTPRSS